MPTPTYDLIASNVLSSSASSVTFSSLDTLAAGYRDLILVIFAIGSDSANKRLYVQINGDTGSNYSNVSMAGDGTTPTSTGFTNDKIDSTNKIFFTNTNALLAKFDFLDWSVTDKHKTLLSRMNVAQTGVTANAHRWASTSAITSLYIFPSNASFASGSTFYLFGIVS